jgi:hypothetical protein
VIGKLSPTATAPAKSNFFILLPPVLAFRDAIFYFTNLVANATIKDAVNCEKISNTFLFLKKYNVYNG